MALLSSECPNLIQLNLSECQGLTSKIFGPLSKLSRLENLYLNGILSLKTEICTITEPLCSLITLELQGLAIALLTDV